MFLSSDYGESPYVHRYHHSPLGEVIQMSPPDSGGSSSIPPSQQTSSGSFKKGIDRQEFNEATIANLFLLGTIVLLGKTFDKELENRMGLPNAIPDVLSAALLGVMANSVSGSLATALTGGKKSFLGTVLSSAVTALPFIGLLYSVSQDYKSKGTKWDSFQVRSGLGLSVAISIGLSLVMNRALMKKNNHHPLLAKAEIK